MKPFEILEHTADVAILARGRDLSELIANAAAGMLAVLYGGASPVAQHYLEREVQAAETDLLVHHVLRELLYLLEDEALAPVSVTVLKCAATAVTMRVGVIPRADGETHLSALLKAVTRHGLGIDEEEGLLVTRIVFDV